MALETAESPASNDYALMDAIAIERDEDALRQFYDRHASLVYAVCLRVLRDRHEAEDLLVEIFHELWEKADRYDPQRASPRTYLMTLTRSRAIDRKRRLGSASSAATINEPGDVDDAAQSAAGTSGSAAALSPVEVSILSERRGIVIDALRQLEPFQRQAIECAYYDGLSHSEIAQRMQKPLGTVKTYIRQGLIRLRRVLHRESDSFSAGEAAVGAT
jgi:RNA polymerase sigma-70 factor (ECF subfamily)